MGLIKSFGFEPIDLGGLVTGGRLQQAGGPLAGRDSSISATTELIGKSPMRGAMINAFGEPKKCSSLSTCRNQWDRPPAKCWWCRVHADQHE